MRIAEALESGVVSVNSGVVSDPSAPFRRTVESAVRPAVGTQGYMRISEGTRPTLTADQVSQFDADIDTYACV